MTKLCRCKRWRFPSTVNVTMHTLDINPKPPPVPIVVRVVIACPKCGKKRSGTHVAGGK